MIYLVRLRLYWEFGETDKAAMQGEAKKFFGKKIIRSVESCEYIANFCWTS